MVRTEVCSKLLQTTAADAAAGGPKIRKLTRYHNSSYPSGLLIYFDKHLGPREKLVFEKLKRPRVARNIAEIYFETNFLDYFYSLCF
jgi:hypothetical protein